MSPLVSIIVPVFNEQDNIFTCYQRLVATTDNIDDIRFEFIFTDNCSTDNSFSELAKLAKKDERVRVFRFSRNFGYQRSIWTGYSKARGEAAIEFDCDLQDPPEMIGQFIQHWQDGFKIVYGVRRSREEGLLITRLRSLYYRFLNSLSDIELPVDAGDFMLIDRDIINHLCSIRDPNIYIRGTVFSCGFPRVAIPYDRRARKKGESKFPIRKLVSLAADGIVSRSTIPLRFAFILGLIVLLIAASLIFFFFFLWIQGHGSLPTGFTTLVLLILISISLNALLLGIFGEYLARLYSITSDRTITIIETAIENETTKE